MKRIIFSIMILFSLAVIINYIWVTKYAKINTDDIRGVYVYKSNRYLDTLILLKDHTSLHTFFDNTTKEFKSKKGEWGIAVPGTIVIQDYSFSKANYPVDLRYYLDFFWRIRIDFNLSDTYKKLKN